METLRKLYRAGKSKKVGGKKVLHQSQINKLEKHSYTLGSISGQTRKNKVGRREKKLRIKWKRESPEVNWIKID